MMLVGRQQTVKGKERDQSKKERKAFIEFSSELQHSKENYVWMYEKK